MPPVDERLAALLEVPAGAREPEDAELAALVAVAERVTATWGAIEPAAGAAERVHAEAERLAAERRRRFAPRLPRLGLAGWALRAGAVAGLAVAILVTVSLLRSAPGPLGARQILERAEAAISADSRIVHMVADDRTSTVFNGQSYPSRYTVETFTYARPPRRTRTLLFNADGSLQSETSVSGLTVRSYDPQANTITAQSLKGLVPKQPRSTGAGDPLEALRAALGKGGVKVESSRLDSGRRAYVISGTTTSAGAKVRLDYKIDAKTYLPVEFRQRVRARAAGYSSVTETVYRVTMFELLRPVPANLRKLRLARHPGARVRREAALGTGPSPSR